MQALSLEEPPVAIVMLSNLRPSSPVGIDSHRHIELKRTHEHSHADTEKGRGYRDHAYFEIHLSLRKFKSLFCETAFHVILWIQVSTLRIVEVAEMADVIVVQHSVNFFELFRHFI